MNVYNVVGPASFIPLGDGVAVVPFLSFARLVMMVTAFLERRGFVGRMDGNTPLVWFLDSGSAHWTAGAWAPFWFCGLAVGYGPMAAQTSWKYHQRILKEGGNIRLLNQLQ